MEFISWDIRSGTVAQSFHHSKPFDLTIGKVCRNKLAVAQNRDVVIWDIANGLVAKRLFGNTRIRDLEFNEDATILATSEESFITLWDLANGKQVAQIRSSGGKDSLHFGPANKLVCYSRQDNSIKVWNIVSRTAIKDFPLAQTRSRAAKLDFSVNPSILAYTDGEDVVLHEFPHSDFAFRPNLSEVNIGLLWKQKPQYISEKLFSLRVDKLLGIEQIPISRQLWQNSHK